jgi:hypothetical protein
MAFIGNTNTTQAFTPAIDYFSGNASTTAFTLSRPVASVAQVQVTIDNVAQNPSSAYTVSNNTITFTSAPLSGTNNIYVYYTSPITDVIAPGQGTVTTTSFASSTGTGAGVFQTSPTITTPVISSLSSASATALTLQSAGTTAVTIDTSQNVGIGTTSPGNPLHIYSNTVSQMRIQAVSGNTNAQVNLAPSGTGVAVLGTLSGAFPLTFQTNSTEAMRIDSSGNLLVGTTATVSYMDGRIIASATSANPALTVKSFDATQFCSSMWVAATTGTNIFANFLTETTATIRGSITYNRGGGLVAYNTTSDYRAKTVNGSVQNALAKVALLKPSTGRMSGATEDIDFFVAHELQEVVPSAVTGEKDAVNEDNTPKYQMVDKSALIPLLTKAIQELKAINDTQAETINALTARIEALENR